MTTSPIEVREEIDVVSVDPLFIERQRNRYSSRAVAYVVWLNGLAAIALLIGLTHASLRADQVKGFLCLEPVQCDLASSFFAYIGRTFRLERPHLIGWRRPIRWLAILAAIAGAVCFIGALNMSRMAALPKEAPAAPSTAIPQPEPSTPSSPKP